ncbi:MAG: hypothetical protein ACXV5J_02540, partial [Candidatus Angelobacter sp.]
MATPASYKAGSVMFVTNVADDLSDIVNVPGKQLGRKVGMGIDEFDGASRSHTGRNLTGVRDVLASSGQSCKC